ncbi:hypothetical protein [Escherichia sp. MOD1-EC6842]|uniref:hypothetical protein n=1 Tax=Escherichia sp. MOD1-EC6842 TaxID=2093899 RepID=UPI002570DAE0|nr:hypothetical protein [Escherichia sp. MOD1-EC6842]
MKQIFLMSQCQYTHLWLSELMESAGKHAVQVISVETPEQIVSHIQSDNHLPGKQRVIVVDLTCHESSVMVKALWFLWNLSVLYSERHELRGTPCIFYLDIREDGIISETLLPGFLLHKISAN